MENCALVNIYIVWRILSRYGVLFKCPSQTSLYKFSVLFWQIATKIDNEVAYMFNADYGRQDSAFTSAFNAFQSEVSIYI